VNSSVHFQLVVGLGNPGKQYVLTRHNLGFLTVERYLEDALQRIAALHKISSAKLLKQFGDKAWRQKYSSQFFELGNNSLTQGLNGLGVTLQESDLGAACWLLPLTFMNLSGQAVRDCSKSQGIKPSSILVIHDELDLPPATIRIKFGGGHGGHNGLRSIIEELGTADFWRLRVGVGKPNRDSGIDGADYVLSKLSLNELQPTIDVAAEALATVLNLGPQKGMQTINSIAKKEEP
jgi:PTH1 family peptidyl-tRNA hydrolase